MFEPLGSVIRSRREELGLTIDGLAIAAKVSRTRLINLEKGDDNVSLGLLVKIANALGIGMLPVGGLRLVAATPEFETVLAAADVVRKARQTLSVAAQACDEFERAAGGPMAELFANTLSAAAPDTMARPARRAGNGE